MASGSLLLRVSVPAEGGLRTIATELAAKVAEFLGDKGGDASSATAALELVAARVCPDRNGADILFEFRQVEGELLIQARCGGRSSEVRCPLPA